MKTTPVMLAEADSRCSNGCCRTNSSMWYKLLKLFLVVAVFLLIFCLGAASVVHMSGGVHRKVVGSTKMYPVSGAMMDWSDGRGMKMEKKEATSWQRMFGTITKIEGNNLTLLDNAAAETVVMSTQDTIIIQAGAEVGLATLKVGQNVVVVFSLTEERQQVAKTISVQ